MVCIRLVRFNEGAVAQLGERLICIQEAAGSIPTSSTKFSATSAKDDLQSVWRDSNMGL